MHRAVHALLLIALASVACGSESSKPPPTAKPTAAVSPLADTAVDTLVETARLVIPELGWIGRVAVQPDGKILLIGELAIARVRADFSLDPDFGEAGLAHLRSHKVLARDVEIDANGRILVVGYVYSDTKGQRENLRLARLLPGGKLDPTFGTRGIVTADYGNTDDRPTSVFVLSTGEIAVIGTRHHSERETYDGYLAKFDAAGKPIASFGAKGVVFFDPVPNTREFVTRTVRASDGSFVLGGYAVSSVDGAASDQYGVFVSRLRVDGTLDDAFAAQGTNYLSTSQLGHAVAWALAVTPRGEILLGGQTGEQRGFVLRFLSTGRIDKAWGDEGVAWGPADQKDWPGDLIPLGETTLAIGYRIPGTLLLRFTARGALDRQFASGGVLRGTNDADSFAAGALDGDRNIIAVGKGDPEGFVVRFTSKRVDVPASR